VAFGEYLIRRGVGTNHAPTVATFRHHEAVMRVRRRIANTGLAFPA
jgi:hypothetical protein